jgi:hypothetical protein
MMAASKLRTAARALLATVVAVVLWVPNLHHFYRVDLAEARRADGPTLTGLAERPVHALLTKASGIERMRAVNPEWDFMTRTYTVLGLANLALGDPRARARHLADIDRVIEDTLAFERERGDFDFMMAYARRGPFVDPEARSLFIDGELLVMLAARDLVAPDARYATLARQRATRVERAMTKSPSMSGESYPNECWTFCNTTALAGLRMLDRAEGTDHAELLRAWVAYARAHLVEPRTGLLVSSYTYEGATLDGPEGSSLWMSAHNLLVVDEAFARDQYARAKRELAREAYGFAWAREWPLAVPGRPDVDSGPIVPILEASAGSSGLALLGASAFGDDAFFGGLLSSMELAAFPERSNGRVRYRASNEVGDAVTLYALSFGPLWDRVRSPAKLAGVTR